MKPLQWDESDFGLLRRMESGRCIFCVPVGMSPNEESECYVKPTHNSSRDTILSNRPAENVVKAFSLRTLQNHMRTSRGNVSTGNKLTESKARYPI